jgi:hypothetical protein
MPHPSLGLPPADVTAGHPAAGTRIRRERLRLARLALEATVRAHPGFRARYDENELRLLLRDLDQHLERLARALETGDPTQVTAYAEWLVPVYRRREVPMKDFIAMLTGIRDAVATVLTPAETADMDEHLRLWRSQLEFHRRLPGDHPGNSVVRFFWKGAGILDDEIV